MHFLVSPTTFKSTHEFGSQFEISVEQTLHLKSVATEASLYSINKNYLF